FALVGPIERVALGGELGGGQAGDGGGRSLGRIFPQAQAEQRLEHQRFLPGVVVDEEQAIPLRLLGVGGRRSGASLGLGQVAEDVGVVKERSKLIQFRCRELRRGFVLAAVVDQVFGESLARRGQGRVIPERENGI